MKFFKIIVLVSIISIMPYGVIAEEKDDALVILSSENIMAMEEAVSFIEGKGGRIVHIFPTHILIGDIPKEIMPDLVSQKGILSIHYDLVDTALVEKYGKMAVYAVEGWNRNYVLPPAPKVKEVKEFAPLINDVLIPPISAQKVPPSIRLPLRERPYGAQWQDTSEYMIGRIMVIIILPESNGTIGTETENWTPDEESNVIGEIQNGMNWWANRETKAGLQFAYKTFLPSVNPTIVSTGYEPITKPGGNPGQGGEEGDWILEIMNNIGVDGITYFDKVREHNDKIRAEFKADWCFTIFVVDSSVDDDGEFSNGYFAYAYLGGPFMVMTYKNSNYGIGNMDAVCAHETGHIFYALDEYPGASSPDEYTGYLWVKNENHMDGGSTNEPCIMRGQVTPFTNGNVCHCTRGQIGIWDNNSNGILDILDTGELILSDPIGTTTLNYKGTITVLPPLINNNPYINTPHHTPPGNNITVSAIANIQYKVDQGNWIDIENIQVLENHAHNGTLTARFEFTTPRLVGNYHSILVRAINSIGYPNQAYYAIDIIDNLTQIVVYPNPFYSKDKQITFVHLPDNSIVKIFTIAGELVTTITGDNVTGEATWQPTGIASGIYLYVVESEGVVVWKGKLGILR
ncbi:MAG: T9SS type A sorting domain-containing protein [bacterium]